MPKFSPASTLSIATNALIQASQNGIPWTLPLVDKSPMGSFWVRVGITVGTGATNIAISLPRKPSGCITINSTAGTMIYQTAGDQAATTPSNFVCRSTSSTTAIILVA